MANPFNYEHRGQPPLSPSAFSARMIQHGGYAALLVALSAVMGMAGYHWFGRLAWIDAFLNACMLLGGMGPVGELGTTGGKLFASLFALYAGLVFLVCTAILLTPVIHHMLHKHHWEADQEEEVR